MLEVVGNIIKALGLCKLDQHSSGSFPVPVTADGTVAEVPAWRTLPVGIHQGFIGILPVPNLKAPPTELPPDPHALPAPADGLGVVSTVFCLHWWQLVPIFWLGVL